MAPLLFSLAINPFASVIKKRLKGIDVFAPSNPRKLIPHVTQPLSPSAFDGNLIEGKEVFVFRKLWPVGFCQEPE